MSIRNKNILITGAASGIGRALVEKLAKDNSILAVDIANEGLELLQKMFPKLTVLHIDLLVEGAEVEVMKKAYALWDRVDMYFANAGFGTYGHWHEVQEENFQDIFRINVTIPFLTAKALKKAQSSPFRLIVTASAVSYWTVPGYSVYSASKAAMHQLAEGIRAEGDGDWLTLVYPASTDTSFFAKAGKEIPKAYPVQSAEKVAEYMIRGVAKNKKYIYPSTLFRLALLVNRWIPLIKPLYTLFEQRKFQSWSNRSTSKKLVP